MQWINRREEGQQKEDSQLEFLELSDMVHKSSVIHYNYDIKYKLKNIRSELETLKFNVAH